MYISNGSNNIYVVEPKADGSGLNIVRVINVKVGDRRVYFNEIEMVENQYIYANNFLTDEIYKFRKDDGTLIKIWNVEDLMKKQREYVIKNG
jgi:glutamine cyclotransferase